MRVWTHQPGGAGASCVGVVHCPAPPWAALAAAAPAPRPATPHAAEAPARLLLRKEGAGGGPRGPCPEPFPTNSKARSRRPPAPDSTRVARTSGPNALRSGRAMGSWWGGPQRDAAGEGRTPRPKDPAGETDGWGGRWARSRPGLSSRASGSCSPVGPGAQAGPGHPPEAGAGPWGTAPVRPCNS